MLKPLSPGREAHIAPIQIGRPLGTVQPVLSIARHLDIEVEDSSDLHVTLIWSRRPVNWALDIFQPRAYPLIIDPQPFEIIRFDDKAVLKFKSKALDARNASLTAAGARSDSEAYVPHITLGRWPGSVSRTIFPLDAALVLAPEYRKPAKI